MRSAFAGLGLLLAAAATGALLSTQPQLVLPVGALALAAFGIAGVLSLPPVRRRFRWAQTDSDRRAALRATLGDYLARGNDLMREIGPLKNEHDPIEALKERATAWVTEVRDYLDRETPGWSAAFLNDSYRMQTVSQYGHRDILLNWLERRIAKLSELLQRV
ncbi:MAG: hypothetical protein ABI725_02325 [Chloroflexota bacterium]